MKTSTFIRTWESLDMTSEATPASIRDMLGLGLPFLRVVSFRLGSFRSQVLVRLAHCLFVHRKLKARLI